MAGRGVIQDEHHILLLRFGEADATDDILDEVSSDTLTQHGDPSVVTSYFADRTGRGFDDSVPQWAEGAADPATALDLLGEWTVEIQTKLNSLPAVQSPLVLFKGPIGGLTLADSYLSTIYVLASGKLRTFWEQMPAIGPFAVATQVDGVSVAAGEDVRITIVKEQSGPSTYSVLFYINGELQDTVTGLPNAAGGSAGRWFIANEDNDFFADAEYYEIAVSDIVRSPAYIRSNYLRARAGDSASGAVPATVDTGAALATFGDELCLFDSTRLFSYSVANDGWAPKGDMQSTTVTQRSVRRDTYNQTDQDSATHESGIQVFAWKDSSGGARYSVVDRSTSQSLVSSALLDSQGIHPKVAALGAAVVVLYQSGSDNNIYGIAVDTLNPTVAPTPVLIASDAVADAQFDICVLEDRIYLAYENNAGSMSLLFVAPGLIVTGPVILTGSLAGPTAVTIFPEPASDTLPDGALVVVGYDGTTVGYSIVDPGLVEVNSSVAVAVVANVFNIVGYSVGRQEFSLFLSVAGATSSKDLITRYNIDGVTVTPAGTVRRSVSVASKVFERDDQRYLLTYHSSTLQPTYFLMTEFGDTVAKICPLAAGQSDFSTRVTSANMVSADVFQFAVLQKDLLTTDSSQANPAVSDPFSAVYTSNGVESVELEFANSQQAYVTAELGQNLHISGGFLSAYDGVSVVEHGFHLFPEGLTASVTATSGGNLSAGDYQYVACYEWTDGKGRLHRSAPSLPVTVTATSADIITVVLPTLRVTAKPAVSIVVYRTEANGVVFYRDSTVSSPVINDTSVDTVNFVSSQADTALIVNPQLYTTGGVLENVSPPACGSMTSFKNCLVVLPTDRPLSWWCSKVVGPDAPVEFSDLLENNVDPVGGKLTVAATLDDKLILFKESSIFFVAGDGPTPNGISNFSEAQLVTTDVGCTDPRSVGVTPMGLVFKSQKGIYLLNRSLQAQYIGADVEAYNDSAVVSALLVPGTNQVRFGLDSGVALVFDYVMGQWDVFTNHNMVDAVVFDGWYTFLQPNGAVRQEDPDAGSDAGAPIKLKLQTAWLALAGLQGFQRAYHMLLLGQYESEHNLQVGVAYDYNSAIVQTEVIEPTAPDSWGSGTNWGSDTVWGGENPLYQFRINFTRQKCQAVQITIEDVQTRQTAGAGGSWSAFTFIVGAKRGTNKLGSTKVFGSA